MNYLIEISLGSEGTARRAAPDGLSLVCSSGALSVWADEAGQQLDGNGWIGGHLFDRARPAKRYHILPEPLRLEIASSSGRILCQKVWGGYVAAIMDTPLEIAILRDPSGMVPAYILEEGDHVLVSSDVRLLRTGPATLDPLALARYLTGFDGIGRRTCLEGIVELLPGEALEVSNGKVRISQWWMPWNACRSGKDVSVQEGAHRVRDAITNCCSAWGSSVERPLLGVSGGLDSSIVAATIGTSRMITFVGPDAEGDETYYAKALADALGAPLESYAQSADEVDVKRATHTHLPWPFTSYVAQASAGIHAQCSLERGFDAIFSGNGGDNVFCYMRSVNPVLDRFLQEGVGRGTWQTLQDFLDWTGATYSDAFRHLWYRYHQPRNDFKPTPILIGLTPEIQAAMAAEPDVHPWHRGPGDILPGKMAHVAMLARAQRTIEIYPRDTGPAHITPLLSQPVMEACLAVPTWHWIAGGQNRAVARMAFKDALPPAIIGRRSKGGPEGLLQAVYRQQHAQVREMLLNGILLKNGIIDRRFVDQPDDWTAQGGARAQRLLLFAGVEAWAQNWQSRPAPSV